MNWISKLMKPLIIMFFAIFIFMFFITILNYFNLISYKIVKILKILIPVLSTLFGGFIMGINCEKKGWLVGLKLGLSFLLILILFNILGLKEKLILKNFIYYLILLISTIIGSMIGINNKNV